MKKCNLFMLLFIAGSLLSYSQQSTTDFGRKYKLGDTYRYRMTTVVVHNNKWQSTIDAVCELRVVNDSGNIPYDEVKWISKKVYTTNDTMDFPEEINRVSPYRISLHPQGRLDIPPIQEAGMTGEITDFNTFFVAISPKLGITQLRKPRDQFSKPENVQGNFANGKDILKGDDCLAVTSTLLRRSKDEVVIQTDFLPPAMQCLHYYTPDMSAPIVDKTINNFQMVRASAGGKVNLFYGREKFLINSTIKTIDGKLIAATMINTLTLQLKLNCDTDYSNCQHSMPFTIDRTIKLELLP